MECIKINQNNAIRNNLKELFKKNGLKEKQAEILSKNIVISEFLNAII